MHVNKFYSRARGVTLLTLGPRIEPWRKDRSMKEHALLIALALWPYVLVLAIRTVKLIPGVAKDVTLAMFNTFKNSAKVATA